MKYRIDKSLFMGLFASALMVLSASASLLVQVDHFDIGLENWGGQNGGYPSLFTHEINGGPEGAGDAYLQLLRGVATVLSDNSKIRIFNRRIGCNK